MKVKLSSRSQYGMRAMAFLAKAWASQAARPVSIRVIAESEDIPEQFLEQIFVELRRAGLVRSIRGAQGGYVLARPPQQIAVGEVVRVLEGPLGPTECVDRPRDQEEECCVRYNTCATRQVWEKLHQSMLDVLDHTTLGDLVREGQPALVQGRPSVSPSG